MPGIDQEFISNLISGTQVAPTIQLGKRVIYSLPKNPADKATIVSIFPRDIVEVKYTIFPQRYTIPAAEPNDFSLLVLSGASSYIPSSTERMPPTEVQINSAHLADSILKDYFQSTLLVNNTRRPGLFWIPGEFDKKTILSYPKFNILLDTARDQQKEWFIASVEEADVLWSRTNGNPRSISDDARLAADLLGLSSQKPWMSNLVASRLDACPACGELINLDYPVCKYCHAVIDKKKADELGLTFAGK